MPVELEGGCRVSAMREGEPSVEGALRTWNRVGRATGAHAISLRILEIAAGGSAALRNSACDEIFFAISGHGTFRLDGREYEIESDTGFYLAPGGSLEIESRGPGPLLLASSRCPDPDGSGEREPREAAQRTALPVTPPARPVSPRVRLGDRASETTGDRWYKTLVGREQGSHRVTQFVGAIPPGRAPDHFHHYEEVLVVLRGEGRMWAGEASTPIQGGEAGSCIYLPRGQVHCVENTGRDEFVLLGVFYPSGSPAVSYEAPSRGSGTA
jgi:mannose-6-phosphate isomerase-like protein (cupin superfamily)